MVEQDLSPSLFRELFVQLRDVRAGRISGMDHDAPKEVQRAACLHRQMTLGSALVEGVLAEGIDRE